MEFKTARRMSEIKASEIREILKITERPEVISFAGGLPAPELFPIDEIKVVNQAVLEEDGHKALQHPLHRYIFENILSWLSDWLDCRR